MSDLNIRRAFLPTYFLLRTGSSGPHNICYFESTPFDCATSIRVKWATTKMSSYRVSFGLLVISQGYMIFIWSEVPGATFTSRALPGILVPPSWSQCPFSVLSDPPPCSLRDMKKNIPATSPLGRGSSAIGASFSFGVVCSDRPASVRG